MRMPRCGTTTARVSRNAVQAELLALAQLTHLHPLCALQAGHGSWGAGHLRALRGSESGARMVVVVGSLLGAIVYVVIIFYMMNGMVPARVMAQIWSSSGFSLLSTQLQILSNYGILVAPWPADVRARLAATGTLFNMDID